MTLRRSFHDDIDSTHLEARRAFSGTALLVVAGRQSAGMGRRGRTWESPHGGLWMSLAWPMRAPLATYQAVPLAVGLATAQAIETVCGLMPKIKWPNDVVLGDRKVAGVLCQTERDVLIAGVGINANFPAAVLPASLRTPPATLLDETGGPIDLRALESVLTDRLVAVLQAVEDGDFARGILPSIRERLCWIGARVSSADGAGTIFAEGILRDVDPSGALVLETPDGARAISVGELRRVER